MSETIHSLLVILEKDVHEETAKALMQAIRFMKCVLTVMPEPADHVTAMAEERAKNKLRDQLWKIV